jgi:hypothetical protein
MDRQAVGGFGGIIGRKKGAVAMYLNFSGIRMVFVCCHLAGMSSIFILCFCLSHQNITNIHSFTSK